MEKNYTNYHTIEYPENSGKFYIFNPYVMGQGAWAELTKNNKPGKNVNSQLQLELNRFFFGKQNYQTCTKGLLEPLHKKEKH